MFGLVFIVAACAASLLIGWYIFPAPTSVTNWWRSWFDKEPLVEASSEVGIVSKKSKKKSDRSEFWGE